MGFLRSSSSLVGLDIGSDRLKAVELVRAGNGFRLNRVGSVASPSSAFRDGVPVSTDEIATQIRALFEKTGIRTDRVVVGAGGQSVTVREVRVPPMNAQELTAAVRYEAERYLPYNVQDVYMDYHVLGESLDDGRKMLDVVVVATRQEVVQRIVEAVQGARLVPYIVDVEAFALMRSLMNPADNGDKTLVFVDLGAEASDLVITEGPRYRLTRNIPIGGSALIGAIEEALGVDTEAAKRLLEERGEILEEGAPADAQTQAIYDAIAPHVGDLITEVRRSLDYHLTRTRSAVVSKVFLSGGLARLKHLDKAIAAELGVPVEVGHPFARLQVNQSAVPQDQLEAMSPVMSVAVGLALRGGDEN